MNIIQGISNIKLYLDVKYKYVWKVYNKDQQDQQDQQDQIRPTETNYTNKTKVNERNQRNQLDYKWDAI